MLTLQDIKTTISYYCYSSRILFIISDFSPFFVSLSFPISTAIIVFYCSSTLLFNIPILIK